LRTRGKAIRFRIGLEPDDKTHRSGRTARPHRRERQGSSSAVMAALSPSTAAVVDDGDSPSGDCNEWSCPTRIMYRMPRMTNASVGLGRSQQPDCGTRINSDIWRLADPAAGAAFGTDTAHPKGRVGSRHAVGYKIPTQQSGSA
jgi:hypothetical protein